ncbi:hypothetical protein BD626DRAFT_505071 [Schizophyllum amplum]|uniref:Uncharacterized protein n=1 Tax=Schizophyllum amplum TaxID=97359 RepID=A0A550C6D9_9AGAR|nr:hypothetical protein BD626DRAFT_505071 [Auriculariopsis ampla]
MDAVAEAKSPAASCKSPASPKSPATNAAGSKPTSPALPKMPAREPSAPAGASFGSASISRATASVSGPSASMSIASAGMNVRSARRARPLSQTYSAPAVLSAGPPRLPASPKNAAFSYKDVASKDLDAGYESRASSKSCANVGSSRVPASSRTAPSVDLFYRGVSVAASKDALRTPSPLMLSVPLPLSPSRTAVYVP